MQSHTETLKEFIQIVLNSGFQEAEILWTTVTSHQKKSKTQIADS